MVDTGSSRGTRAESWHTERRCQGSRRPWRDHRGQCRPQPGQARPGQARPRCRRRTHGDSNLRGAGHRRRGRREIQRGGCRLWGVRHYRSSRPRAAPRIDEESDMPLTHITDLATLTRSGAPDMPTSPPKPQRHHQLLDASQPAPAGQPRLAGRRARHLGHAAARPRRFRPALRALLLAGAVAAMLGLPAGAQAGLAVHAGKPVDAAVPATAAAPSGGVCSVPGIGDIGGLLGFCAAGSSGIIGDLNNICQPSVPTPEPATGGIDALISPPPNTTSAKQPATLYDSYGMAGQSWAAYDLQCSDMASLVGNNIAGVVFDAAKALDRVTITVY